MAGEIIEITIKNDGQVTFDQQGYDGQECINDIDDLINAVGTEVRSEEKNEIYQKQQWLNQEQGR